jgi:hypothetical protein
MRAALIRNRETMASGVAAALALGLLGASDAASAFSLNGSESQVNSYTLYQTTPSVASDAAGNFVVTWEGKYATGGGTAGYSVLARRYDANGSPIGAPFQVSTYMTSTFSPSIASDAAGNFVVVWTSDGSAGSDTHYSSIQGRRFNPSGAPVGTQFQVNTYTIDYQDQPAVATDGAGNFVVVWASNGSAGSDKWDWSVQGQRYDANGSPIGAEFQVNTYTTGNQLGPSVASDSAGNFVVVWTSNGYVAFGHYRYAVQGQRFDASGSPVRTQFQVNSYTTGTRYFASITSASVASDSAGNFVVVWASNGSPGSDNDGSSIQGQRYDASGSPVGTQFQVNTYTTGPQSVPSVASDSQGDFIVTWQSTPIAGGDTSLRAQRYDTSGSPAGDEFQVNTRTGVVAYRRASVASDSAGKNVVAVWTSQQGFPGFPQGYSFIEAQRFLPEPSFVPSLGAMLAMMVVLARRRRI